MTESFSFSESGWLPPGYKFNGYIYQTVEKDGTTYDSLVYMGYIAVVGCYIEYFSDPKLDPIIYYEVEFDSTKDKKHKIKIPAAKMGTAIKAAPILLSGGAIISDKNAKAVCHYLMMSYHHQKDTIKTTRCTRQLGIVGGVLVTPTRSVPPDDMEYIGPSLEYGSDKKIYKERIKDILEWGQASWPLLFCLGASLVSPFISDLTPAGSPLRRNPAIGLIGPSNYGKTTTAFFAAGVWGDPCTVPFYVSAANKNTDAGKSQLIEFGNGLPLIIDESHQLSKDDFQNLIYNHANKIGRVTGTLSGSPSGGKKVRGTVFFCGEGFRVTEQGSLNRVIIINVDHTPPLGVRGLNPNGSNEEGLRRSNVLSEAWNRGGGFLGPDMYEYIFTDKEMELEFKGMIDGFMSNPKFSQLNGMAGIVSVIQAEIIFLLTHMGIPTPAWVHDIPLHIKGCLEKQGKSHETDPSLEAFEKIRSMIGQSVNIPLLGEGGVLYKIREETVAWTHAVGDKKFIAVLLNTQALKQYVGDIQKYYGVWKSIGLLTPSKNSNTTPIWNKANTAGGTVRCILLNIEQSTDILEEQNV